MKIFAIVAGVYNASVPVSVEPRDSIPTLFRLLEKQLCARNLSSTFTAAYAIVPGLSGDHPDYFGLRQGDPGTVAQYLTPTARIDPTNSKKKTVRDYLGDHVTDDTVCIVLTWPIDSILEEQQERERGTIATAAYLAIHRSTHAGPTTPTLVAPSAPTFPRAVETEKRASRVEQEAAGVAVASPPFTPAASPSTWQRLWSSYWSLASCSGLSTTCGRSDE